MVPYTYTVLWRYHGMSVFVFQCDSSFFFQMHLRVSSFGGHSIIPVAVQGQSKTLSLLTSASWVRVEEATQAGSWRLREEGCHVAHISNSVCDPRPLAGLRESSLRSLKSGIVSQVQYVDFLERIVRNVDRLPVILLRVLHPSKIFKSKKEDAASYCVVLIVK